MICSGAGQPNLSVDEMVANAKLIAKAPEMFEELKRTLRVLRKWGHEGADTYPESEYTYRKGIDPVEKLIKEVEE